MELPTCRRWTCTDKRPCERCTRATNRAPHVDWFQRTGHCGACGQPGSFCLCTERHPCGCRDLHPMGSGVDTDPAAIFAITTPDDQPELFT